MLFKFSQISRNFVLFLLVLLGCLLGELLPLDLVLLDGLFTFLLFVDNLSCLIDIY